MGVIPHVIQSDNEFDTFVINEMLSLLGSLQFFSSAFHPQSQGIVERSHRDIRRGLAKLIEQYARANPSSWPDFIRHLEARLRHKRLPMGATPFAVVHGFYGSSLLESAISRVEGIPVGIPDQEWLDFISTESERLSSELAEFWSEQALSQARKSTERTMGPPFAVGDLVLLSKPVTERGAGSILPQCDGPYRVSRLLGNSRVMLEDALTGDPYQIHRPVTVDRLVRFSFPGQYADPDPGEIASAVPEHLHAIGTHIAVELVVEYRRPRVYIARIERVHTSSELYDCQVLVVPKDQRYGPRSRHPWYSWVEGVVSRRELIAHAGVITTVELTSEHALTESSLEKLVAAHVPLGAVPHQEMSLPSRR